MKINSTKWVKIAAVLFFGLLGLCLLHNLHGLFFPVEFNLHHDEAEHLHAAYLLQLGERPFMDFIENHPMLFQHFLNLISPPFSEDATKSMANRARVIVFFHFLLCLALICLWTTRYVKERPHGIGWAVMLAATLCVTEYYRSRFSLLWQIRPDFIAYAHTLGGSYLLYRAFEKKTDASPVCTYFLLISGGILVGLGNAVLPKGAIILLAIGLAYLTKEFITEKNPLDSLLQPDLLRHLAVFATATMTSFCAFALLDCRLSQIPLAKWIAGVLLINSRRHVVFALMDNNPITTLLKFFCLPFPLMLAFSVWAVWELQALKNAAAPSGSRTFLWLLAIYTILCNLFMLSYSNGVSFAHNLIPSFFAVIVLYLLLFLRVGEASTAAGFIRRLSFSRLAIVLIIIVSIVKFINHPVRLAAHYGVGNDATEDMPSFAADTAIQEDFPASFVFFATHPHRMPVRNRHWGFYSMLSDNGNFWNDCHALGIGPDPKDLEKGFGEFPPDALTFTDLSDVTDYITMVKRSNKIDVSWFREEVNRNYVLMGKKQLSLFVRKEKISFVQDHGWKPIVPPGSPIPFFNRHKVDGN